MDSERFVTITKKMTIHEKWMLMSMPKMRATRIEPGMFSEHKAKGGPRAALHPRLVPLVLVVDLASDLTARLRRRVNVGVRDSGADRGDELVPLTGCDARSEEHTSELQSRRDL